VGAMDLRVLWPSLPPERHAAAVRAAGLCTIKKTLERPPAVSVEVGA
jgi:hypothetical protein